MATINTSELARSFNEGEPLSFSFFYPSENTIKTLNAILAKILATSDRIFLLDMMVTILREIIINATKANAKRIYFQKMNLDIANHETYLKGIQKFKEDIVGQLDRFEGELKKSNLKVTFYTRKEDDGIKFIVTNNAPILPEELERINLRLDNARRYKDFTEAYEEIYDETEGAGLGIVLVVLLLKSSGIDPAHYTIKTDGKVTQASLFLPYQMRPEALTTSIKQQVLDDIEGIPTFPKQVLELIQMCKRRDVEIRDISTKIMQDPALSTDVLKLANSAGFITGKRIESLNEAVMNIGLKNLEALLIATSARKILDKRYTRFEQIWEHCNRTSFYARTIATHYKLGNIIEHASLAGLLHDLGKIILLSTDLEVTNWIADLVADRKMRTSTVMEEVSIGISHSTIGELIAKKWQLPDYLVTSIRYHHTPLEANTEFSEQVRVTYLANMLCGVENRKYQYYYIEESILQHFKLSDEEDLKVFHQRLKDLYNGQS
ncbi:MAG: HDOD domain-containing protein [Spirochaetota bacterium]